MSRFRCPTCNQALKVAAQGPSEVVGCPACGQGTLLPARLAQEPEEEYRPRARRRRTRRRRGGGPALAVALLLLAGLLLLGAGGAGVGVYFLTRSPVGLSPRQRLVGTWEGVPPAGGHAVIEYRGDGTLGLTVSRVRDGQHESRTVEGTWEVLREGREELTIHESAAGIEGDTVITFEGPDRHVRKAASKPPAVFTRRR